MRRQRHVSVIEVRPLGRALCLTSFLNAVLPEWNTFTRIPSSVFELSDQPGNGLFRIAKYHACILCKK